MNFLNWRVMMGAGRRQGGEETNKKTKTSVDDAARQSDDNSEVEKTRWRFVDPLFALAKRNSNV